MGNKMCCDDSRKEENPLDKVEGDVRQLDDQLELVTTALFRKMRRRL